MSALDDFLIELRDAPKHAAPPGVVTHAMATVTQLFHNLQTQDGHAVELHDEVVKIISRRHLSTKERLLQLHTFLVNCPRHKLATVDIVDELPAKRQLQ